MSFSDENRPKNIDQIECIFPTMESALYTLHVYSLGLESTQIADFNFSARIGLANLQRQICLTGFKYLDKENSTEKKEDKKIIKLIEREIKEKKS